MFDKPLFAALLRKAMGDRSINQYWLQSDVSATYISKLLRELVQKAPGPEVIRKLASTAQNGVTYGELMGAAGHLTTISVNEFYSKHAEHWPRIKRAMVDVLSQYVHSNQKDAVLQTLMQRENLTEDQANEVIAAFSDSLDDLPDAKLLPILEACGAAVSVGQDDIRVDLSLPMDKKQPPQPPANRRIPLPVIGIVCAGNGGSAFQEQLGFEYVDESDIKGMANCFWLRVKGDSMIGEGIMENDLALVWQKDDVDSGSLAVVIVDGTEGQIKRIIKKDGAIVLQAANPTYPLAMFTGEETSRVRIVGQVVETKRKYRK